MKRMERRRLNLPVWERKGGGVVGGPAILELVWIDPRRENT